MQLVQLFVQIEAAHDTVDELGKLGLVQFRDLNVEVSAFQRNFVNEVKRCDEMERKLRFFGDQIEKEKKEIEGEKQKGRDEIALLRLEDIVANQQPDTRKVRMDELESQFDELEKEQITMNTNQDMLNRNYNELIELKHVLHTDDTFFAAVGQDNQKARLLTSAAPDAGATVKLGFVTGVILREKFPSFERVLWRATRGNLFMKHAEIEDLLKDPNTSEMVEKNVFIIFYQGERSQAKIKKICESFGANLYPCPDTHGDRKELLNQVTSRLDDLENVLSKTRKHRRSVLLDIGKNLKFWVEKVQREKAIYHTMNWFNYDIGRKCLIAEGWCPKAATERIVNAMRQATESSGALVPSILSVIQTTEDPPTFFKTNKFSQGFQAIVDAYGIARYGEINPTPFSIITFPFLFAVMFGDLGHGFLMTITALYMCINERKLAAGKLNEMIQTCFEGRYLLLLMGLFSMYTGILYNDIFSIPMDIFGSNWRYIDSSDFAVPISDSYVYPLGVDPVWKGANNALTYLNSMKMKLSIILGVCQMSMGIFVSLFNALHFNKKIDIWGVFLPQILFLQALFGYMCLLIIVKWLTPWPDPSKAPFLLTVMINMFLSPTSLADEDRVFSGQLYLQWALLLVAIVTVPWMLCAKPQYLKSEHKKQLAAHPKALVEEEHDKKKEAAHGGGHGGGHGHEEEFDFGEIMVHQVIHTIEFVLGAISNTASYLRLWALSLAHAQLSEVFWERVLLATLDTGNFFLVFIGFGGWAGATIGVLMLWRVCLLSCTLFVSIGWSS